MDSVQISGATIAKRLASCNQTARSRAVRLLTRWLPQQSSATDALTDGDLVKIWKGLFYCVWHADKLPFQLDLINRLSGLLETLDSDLSVRYFETFLITMRREWSGIDFLRLDKFYLLIRKFIHHLFVFLKKNDWDVDLLNRLVTILSEKSLLSTDKFQACGVNYHIAEVFLDEIEDYLPIEPKTLYLLLRPFVCALERSSDRVLVNKIKVNVFERLVQNGVKYLNGESEEVEKLGKYALVLGFSKMFFKSASDEGTVQGNRKVLFGLHEKFLKLEKDFEKSGLEILFDHLGNGNVVEKVESLSTGTVDEDGGSEVRPLKKRKKEKKASDGVEKKTMAKKKRNVTSDSVVDSNGKIDEAAKGENGVESSNGAETKSETKKKKKRKNLPNSAIETNGEISDVAVTENANGDVGNEDLLNFDETVISNLQKQFEKVAAEAGMPGTPVNIAVMKKRKQVKSADKLATISNRESVAGKSGKKVRFSMKSNLVWKPQTPLPPQSLRVPPSATPRGSALKKGVPPGPIKESPPTVKKGLKKARKGLKSVSPAVKRLRKLQILSV